MAVNVSEARSTIVPVFPVYDAILSPLTLWTVVALDAAAAFFEKRAAISMVAFIEPPVISFCP
jgi:hypothetical protein